MSDIDCHHLQCQWQMDVTEIDPNNGFAVCWNIRAAMPNDSSLLRQQLAFTIDNLWLDGKAFDAFCNMLHSQSVAELYDMSLNLVARLTLTDDACTMELNPATAAKDAPPVTAKLTLSPDFYSQLGHTLQQFAKWW